MAFANNNKGIAVFDGASQTLPGRRYILAAVWSGYADTNTIVIQDGDGSELAAATAGADGKIEFPQLSCYWATDLTVSTLGGGKLYVHYG